MMYHTKALSIVFRTIFKKNRLEIFDFWFIFELIIKILSNCNSLFELNLSRENLVFFQIKGSFGVFQRNFGSEKLKIQKISAIILKLFIFLFFSNFFQNCFQIDLFFMTLKKV